MHVYGFISVSRAYSLSSSNKLAKHCTVESLYQTQLSQASLQQATWPSSLSVSPLFQFAVRVCFLYQPVHLQSIKREHSKAATQLFKLMTDCNENKHGQSVLIFFSGAIASSVILFTLSPPRPPLPSLQVMPTVIICPLLWYSNSDFCA